MIKKTKIVATISDMNCEPEFIKKLFKAGMNVVRLNTAHQTPEQTLKVVKNVREVSEKIAILIDTKGPEIRTSSQLETKTIQSGEVIKIHRKANEPARDNIISVSYEGFVDEVKVDSRILIDDGSLELLVKDKTKDYLICEATNSGMLKAKKSVNVPGASFNLPSITEKDRQYIEFAADHEIDFVAHSFVRNKQDVIDVQAILDRKNSQAKIISKIENQDGVDNIDEILEHSYGIMVARGDLAIEIPYEKIPGIQKMIVNKCIEQRKPVIIATQMLHSMINEPRATRAEISDIANAIYSKTDAIMLSGETAYGKYPLAAVETMAKVAREVEKSRGDIHDTPIVVISTEVSAYLTHSAVEASINLKAKAIIADTSSGRTIRNIAGFRGRKPVYAMCYELKTVRLLALSFGIYPQLMENSHDGMEFVKKALKKLVKKNKLYPEDTVVVLGGNYGRHHGATYMEIAPVKNLCEKIKSSKR
jgi:pyruvate kinase